MASTYGAGLRARLILQHERGFGVPAFQPTEDMAEEQYQKDLMKGFRRKDGKCNQCFQIRSASGTCGCENPTRPVEVPVRKDKILKTRTQPDRWLEE